MKYKNLIIVFFFFYFSTLVSMNNEYSRNDPTGLIYRIIQENGNDRENKILLGQ
jgi:hypothetical protein